MHRRWCMALVATFQRHPTFNTMKVRRSCVSICWPKSLCINVLTLTFPCEIRAADIAKWSPFPAMAPRGIPRISGKPRSLLAGQADMGNPQALGSLQL